MNEGYRSASAAPSVTLGPLPLRLGYFVAPLVFVVIGLLLVGCGGTIATRERPETLLQCKRTTVGIACDEWIAKKHTSHFESEMRFVFASQTRNASYLYVGEARSYRPGDPNGAAARLKSLGPGEEVVLDVTEPASYGLAIGAAICGLLLAGMGILLGVSASRRRVRVIVRVTPRSLEIDGMPPITRVTGDPVRVGMIQRGGRGTPPTWAILYGPENVPADVLGSWDAFSGADLEPHASQLRQILAAVPRA